MRLDLDLPSQLVLDPRPQKLLLLQHLERHDVLGPFLARQVHGAKLPPPEREPDLEVRQGPAFAFLSRLAAAPGRARVRALPLLGLEASYALWPFRVDSGVGRLLV